MVMRITANNTARILWGLGMTLPLAGMIAGSLCFYRKEFPSHNYAFDLCDKYKITVTEEERQKYEQIKSF